MNVKQLIMERGTENWKVGLVVLYETYSSWGRRKIVRDTPTMWVLDNGDKIRKGCRSPIGHHGIGTERYHSIEEDEGKNIQERMDRSRIISWIKSKDYQNISTENLKNIVTYIKVMEK